MKIYDYPITMEIAGATALFARPDCGDSPVSYPAPTYSAVKAIFESVLWGPAVEVVPLKVVICKPIQWHNYVTNYGGPLRNPSNIKKGTNYQLFASVLIDVCYKLYAVARPNFCKDKLPSSAVEWDRKTTAPGHAYQEIFKRRLMRGQSYASLYLGWKEFIPSYFGPLRNETQACMDMSDIHIPSMFRCMFSEGFQSEYKAIYDTDLTIHKGILVYPKRGEPSYDQ